jgi:uncharacterized glyoxalase superfamily protein PhnB
MQVNPYLNFNGDCAAAFKVLRAVSGRMLVDRFGIPWMVNCEGAVQVAPRPRAQAAGKR